MVSVKHASHLPDNMFSLAAPFSYRLKNFQCYPKQLMKQLRNNFLNCFTWILIADSKAQPVAEIAM
jgi:hypothetical protein